MKILNLTQFLELPENTLFAKYEPCFFDPMSIKMKSIPEAQDFFVVDSLHSCVDCRSTQDECGMLEEAQITGASVSMNFDIQGRDGCFEADQLFAVYESADIEALIERLKGCIP